MKYLSFVVPSYNSEKYLNKCVDSLLKGNEDVEIIIVNDGSSDNTLKIANEYKEKYPSIVKVIDKENGGHGSGVNAGLKVATGLYFKVVDSDDWVDESSYLKLLNQIKEHYNNNTLVDLYFTNYVFERLDLNKSHTENFIKKRFPNNKVFTWNEVKAFKPYEFILMHMVVFKLDVLKKCEMELPENCFYVDSCFAYKPLRYVNTMYYMDVDFYRYYVGRPDQSVTFSNMTKRYHMQLLVTKTMLGYYSYDEIKSLPRKQFKFLKHELAMKLYLALFYVYIDLNKEKLEAYKEYWNDIKNKDKKMYRKLRYGSIFTVSELLIRPIKRIAVKIGYKVLTKKTLWN